MFDTFKKLFKEEDSPVEISVKTENVYVVKKGSYTRLFKTIDILNFVNDWPQTEDELHEVLTNMLLIDMAKKK